MRFEKNEERREKRRLNIEDLNKRNEAEKESSRKATKEWFDYMVKQVKR